MPRPAHALLAPLALFACADPQVVLTPPPGLDATGAVVFVIQRGDATPQLIAAEASATPLLSLDLALEGRTQIFALGYAASLAELDLDAGAIPQIEEARCGARHLPSQDSLHALTFEGRDTPGWDEIDTRPAVVDDLRIGGPCPCRAFETMVTVPIDLAVVAYFDDPTQDRVLLLDRSGGFTWLDHEGALTEVQTATRAPARDLSTVWGQPDGTLWLANGDGELWRGAMNQSFERVAQLDSQDFLRHLAGGEGPNGFELFGVTDEGFTMQLAPGPPRVLTHLRGVYLSEQRSRVLWLGPGRVAATQQSALDVVWLTDGAEVARATLPMISNGARFLLESPDLGLVVLSRDSRLYRAEGFEFTALSEAPELSTPSGVVTFPGGLLYAGDTGYLQEYRTDYGFCPTQYLEGQPPVLGMAPLKDRLFFLTLVPGGENLQALLLEPAPLEE